MTTQDCAEAVRQELGYRRGLPGWQSFRKALYHYREHLEVVRAPIPKATLSMQGAFAIISVPEDLPEVEFEARVWHELGHFFTNRFGLSGQNPTRSNGRNERLVRVIDGRDEELAERWVRAFLLPANFCLQHLHDPEYIATESGCPLELVYARLAELAR
jgi:hypothetical protein